MALNFDPVQKKESLVAVVEMGTAASGTITVTNNTFGGGESVTVNGVAFTEGTDWSAGGDTDATAANIAAAIEASNDQDVAVKVKATVAASVITITASTKGTAGNSITLAESTSGTNFTLSGATLAGGAAPGEAGLEPTESEEFIQVKTDVSVEYAREVVERDILTDVKAQIKPRSSTKSSTANVPVEWKGSGVEGQAPETDLLYRALLGGKRHFKSRVTSGSGHTTTVINVPSHNYIKGDMLVFLESGDHQVTFVESVQDANNVVVFPELASAPADSTEIAKAVTYFPEGNAEPEMTVNYYEGKKVLAQSIGARPASFGVEGIETGQTPVATIGMEGKNYDESITAPSLSPSYDDEVPPIALNVKVYVGDDCLDMNSANFSVENAIVNLNSIKSSNGIIANRIDNRTVALTLTPYLDSLQNDLFDKFNDNEDIKVAIIMYNPSESTAGEIDLGSICAAYFPQVLITNLPTADQDGIFVRNLEGNAHAGSTGTLKNIFIGFC